MPRWHDWAVFTVGLWLAVSPWLVGYASHPAATADAAVAGLVLALAAHFEASCDVSLEWLNLGAGFWLVIAPFLLGFDDVAVATANSVAAGAAIGALAASSLQLDRGLVRLLATASHTLRR
jgi:SPW repeat-containing protein